MTKESISISYKGKDYKYRVGDRLKSVYDDNYVIEITSFKGEFSHYKLGNDGNRANKAYIVNLPTNFTKIKSDKSNRPLKEELSINISFESNSVEGLYKISLGPNGKVLIVNGCDNLDLDILDVDNLVASLLRVKKVYENNNEDTK